MLVAETTSEMAIYMCIRNPPCSGVIPLGAKFYLEADWHGLIHIVSRYF